MHFCFGSCHLSDGHLTATEIGTTTTELHMLFGYQGIKHDCSACLQKGAASPV